MEENKKLAVCYAVLDEHNFAYKLKVHNSIRDAVIYAASILENAKSATVMVCRQERQKMSYMCGDIIGTIELTEDDLKKVFVNP